MADRNAPPSPPSVNIPPLRSYSRFFTTLYDEIKPGNTHYSILRAKANNQTNTYFDFAIIWDEDHDERIIAVLEELHANKILQRFIMVGERKGGFHAILNPNKPGGVMELGSLDIQNGDVWSTTVFHLNDRDSYRYLIHNSEEEIQRYLNAILATWTLGEKTIENTNEALPEAINLATPYRANSFLNQYSSHLTTNDYSSSWEDFEEEYREEEDEEDNFYPSCSPSPT